MKDIAQAVSDPESIGLAEPDRIVKKGERQRLARKLNTYVEGPSARLFQGGVKLDFDQLLRPSKEGRVPLNIVYLNALTSDQEKQFFLATLATELYRWMITKLDATSSRVNLLFYIDEARDSIPAGNQKNPRQRTAYTIVYPRA